MRRCCGTGLLTPETAKELAMPPEQGVGLDDEQGLAPGAEAASQQHQQLCWLFSSSVQRYFFIRCTDELNSQHKAERGETVVVNLRPDADPETEYVVFERWRILRVLERIAADLDDVARPPGVLAPLAPPDEDVGTRYRRRLAEPPPRPRRRSAREERTALRAELGLPPE